MKYLANPVMVPHEEGSVAVVPLPVIPFAQVPIFTVPWLIEFTNSVVLLSVLTLSVTAPFDPTITQ